MAAERPRRGLLVDFGGVLTSSVFDSFRGFCDAEGLPPDAVRDRFRAEGPGRELLFGLEDGSLPEADFERRFAAELGVGSEGLIARLFAGMRLERAMVDAVRAARRQGVRTGLISNSWGGAGYDDDVFAEIFDAVTISAHEGVRKPAPEIYRLGAARIGLEPEDCVFVDDLGGNLKPARALGMATVLHSTAEQTVPELEALLGITLAAGGREP